MSNLEWGQLTRARVAKEGRGLWKFFPNLLNLIMYQQTNKTLVIHETVCWKLFCPRNLLKFFELCIRNLQKTKKDHIENFQN